MVDGLNTHNAAPRNGTPLSGVGGVPSGNLADQVVNSALRYRAQAPLGGGRKQLTAIVIDRSGEPLHKSRDERRDHCVLASV
ncbi:MAG: hypothetical protein FJ147_22750 [Deltaproteobacteria bacterium]|nr:hypothetical protein [Deltaproteobacteria bacterium]